jgi:hypothetical protein
MSKSPKQNSTQTRDIPLVSAPIAAKVLGISRRQFDRLVTEGILQRTAKREFNLLVVGPAFMQYIRDGRERSAKLAEARLRHLDAQAKAIEQRNRERAGELIQVDEVRFAFHGAAASLVGDCEAMPQRVSSDPAIQGTLRSELNAMRSRFANYLMKLAGPEEDSDTHGK